MSDFTGIFYAFNLTQFEEGMEKIGLDPIDDVKLVQSIFGGGYIIKTRVKDFISMMNTHDEERKALKKDHKVLLEGLVYELGNHEYCLTEDADDALNALGIEEKDLPDGMLAKAIKKYNSTVYTV